MLYCYFMIFRSPFIFLDNFLLLCFTQLFVRTHINFLMVYLISRIYYQTTLSWNRLIFYSIYINGLHCQYTMKHVTILGLRATIKCGSIIKVKSTTSCIRIAMREETTIDVCRQLYIRAPGRCASRVICVEDIEWTNTTLATYRNDIIINIILRHNFHIID